MKTVNLFRSLCVLLFLTAAFSSCKKENEELSTEPLSDYLPTIPGKYIVYRLDSLVFTNFGTNSILRSYQEKHEVDAEFTDNRGRKAFRVFRWLRAADGSGAWAPAGTLSIVPLRNTVEVAENNLRSIKLAAPIRQDFAWKGNQFMPADPFSGSYNFSNDDEMNAWEYRYTGVGESLSINNKNYTDVVTVTEVDDDILLDTINVVDNKATINQLNRSKGVWIRGQATADVSVVIPAQPAGTTLAIYNRTSRPVVLDGIVTAPGTGRSLEFINNKWQFLNNEDKPFTETPYGSINHSVRKYAKGIGLVYEELTMWEYQPNPGAGTGYRTGFGVKRSVIEHN